MLRRPERPYRSIVDTIRQYFSSLLNLTIALSIETDRPFFQFFDPVIVNRLGFHLYFRGDPCGIGGGVYDAGLKSYGVAKKFVLLFVEVRLQSL